MYIRKKTRALVKKYLDSENIDLIVRILERDNNYREQVISVIRELKGEQYLVDNAERLCYPSYQRSEDDLHSELVALIEQWNESGYSEERLQEILAV